MDNEIKNILHLLDINVENINELNNFLIPRETLLSDIKYNEIKKLIPELKTSFSSSFLTALQKNADIHQKWPLLNLIRQLLNVYKWKMEPIRKSDGYTLEGVKKYKRFFLIKKQTVKSIEKDEFNKIEIEEEYKFNESIV
jgi:hypothetical protein